MPDIKKSLELLSKKGVYVGVAEDTDDRQTNEMTNALLAFIHTEGAPAQNIPPRPFLQPAIQANKDAIATLQTKAVIAAFAGKPLVVSQQLEKIGMFGRDAVRRWWDDPRNNWAPNTGGTIKRKGSNHPLIDTGQLKNAITYVIE